MKYLILIAILLSSNLAIFGQHELVFDSTFGNNGVVNLPYKSEIGFPYEQTLFLQSDGKMLLMGMDNDTFTLMRLNANGTFDASYNNTWINNPPMLLGNYYSRVSGLLLSNNDFIVCGSDGLGKAVLYKYLENGTIDSLFGDAGILTFSEDSLKLFGNGLIRYDDTSLLVHYNEYSVSPTPFGQKYVLCKINTTGHIDSSFAVNGKFDIPFQPYYSTKIAISPDGSFYILNRFPDLSSYQYNVRKLNADLTIDPGFQFETTNDLKNYFISVIYVDEDGKVVLAAFDGTSKFKLWRLMPNGDMDSSFDRDGRLDGNINFSADNISQMIEQPDGKLLFSLGAGSAVFRVNTNGTLDYSFGFDGFIQVAPRVSTAGIYVLTPTYIALQPDGKIVFMPQIAGLSKVIRVKAKP